MNGIAASIAADDDAATEEADDGEAPAVPAAPAAPARISQLSMTLAHFLPCGLGVGCPPRPAGDGSIVGADDGRVLGAGVVQTVCTLGLDVGFGVGEVVGAAVALGSGAAVGK
jgi:hypothetical protein